MVAIVLLWAYNLPGVDGFVAIASAIASGRHRDALFLARQSTHNKRRC